MANKPPSKPTTGKYSIKPYKCAYCGRVKDCGTNHWGEHYDTCSCSRNGCPPNIGPGRWICLEPVPEGFGVPEPWALVKLGDIADIKLC